MSDLQVRYNVIAPTGFEVKVSGNLGKDPEVRDVNGSKVVKFSLAAKAPDKKIDGTWQKNQVQWVEFNVWENVPGADKIFALLEPQQEWMKLKKGSTFTIEGYVLQESRSHENKAYVSYDVREVTKFNKPPMPPKKSDNGMTADKANGFDDVAPPDNF